MVINVGISPNLVSLEQIRGIERPTDVLDEGLLCDLLWANPTNDIQEWGKNENGISFTFGAGALSRFLTHNHLTLICRGHQVGMGLTMMGMVWS